MGPRLLTAQTDITNYAKMKFALALILAIGLAAAAAAREKRSWISECLHDCDDLPRGQRAPCKADCFRTFDMDDCLLDCERYPPGTAQKNCQKHCIIFGNSLAKKTSIANCLRRCGAKPPGEKAPCKAACFERFDLDSCLNDCERYPEGHARENCEIFCNIFGGDEFLTKLFGSR